MWYRSFTAGSVGLAFCLLLNPAEALERSADPSNKAASTADPPIVTKQASLELTLQGSPQWPVLKVVLRNTGGVPITVDSELVYGLRIQCWDERAEEIKLESVQIPNQACPTREETQKRLTSLPPGKTVTGLVDLHRGWKVLRSATGISLEGGPLLSGYEEMERLPAGAPLRTIVVEYGNYPGFWDGFVGFTRQSPMNVGLFLLSMQQSVEIVGRAEDRPQTTSP